MTHDAVVHASPVSWNPFRPIVELLERRRGLTIGLTGMAAAILAAEMVLHLLLFSDLGDRLAIDYRQYMAATSTWLDGGSFYQPWQLAGPYVITRDELRLDLIPVLYPPTSLLLFVPFAAVPALTPLWWIVPIAIVSAVVV